MSIDRSTAFGYGIHITAPQAEKYAKTVELDDYAGEAMENAVYTRPSSGLHLFHGYDWMSGSSDDDDGYVIFAGSAWKDVDGDDAGVYPAGAFQVSDSDREKLEELSLKIVGRVLPIEFFVAMSVS